MTAEPFPRLLRWTLIAAPSMYGLGVVLALLGLRKEIVLVLYLVGALNALVAVPAAVFLLVCRPHYICRANVVMTLLACIPFALLIVVVVTLSFGPRLHI